MQPSANTNWVLLATISRSVVCPHAYSWRTMVVIKSSDWLAGQRRSAIWVEAAADRRRRRSAPA
jgi:hypothetical protein